MMKKLSKLALLAAATAFLLAACSHSSSGGGNNKDGEDGVDTPQDTYDGSATTDSWNFVGNAEVFSLITNGTNTSANDGVTYTIAEETNITGTDGNLKLTLLTASGTSINYAVQSEATDSASTKGLRFKGEALKISGVKGKVVLAFDYEAAGDSARTLTVKAGDRTWPKDTADKDPHNFEAEINAGSGTEITISATNNYWIKELTISEQTATFTASTNDSTANNLATLGLVGKTVTSSNTTVATATIADGKVKITSVQAGDATISVKNSAGKEATIAVTVKSSGEIEIGTIGKFTRDTPTVDITKKATSNEATDAEGTITWDGLTDLEWSTDGETWLTAADASLTVTAADSDEGKTATVTRLSAGTYYVRAAASDDYEASAKETVSVPAEGGKSVTYTWDASKYEAISDKTTDITTIKDETNAASLVFGPGLRIDGTPQRFNINGSLQKDKNYIKIEVPQGGATVVIHFYNNGSSAGDRSLLCKTVTSIEDNGNLALGDTNWEGTKKTVANSKEDIVETITLTAGDYAIGATNGVYITKIDVTM